MKTRAIILSLSFLLIGYIAAGQTFKTPLEYMDFISNEQQGITKNMWKYTKAIAHSKNEKNVDAKRASVIKSLERAIMKIEKAKSFEGEEEYKNRVLETLRLNENLMKQDYEKIIDMKAVAEQSYDAMEAYMLARELANEKMAEAQDAYEAHFYAYAAKHNIEIIEGETDLGKKMKISNAVFKHYNDMYLVFFKVNINEIYLFDAIETGDVSAILQNANALNQTAKEGLELLEGIELYKNDPSIVNATKNSFEFFIDETETSIPIIVDYLVLNDEVTNINAILEKTPERKRTKEQVDGYNAKVKEINKAVKEYNKINAQLNKQRHVALNKLNTTNQKFLSKHIPNE